MEDIDVCSNTFRVGRVDFIQIKDNKNQVGHIRWMMSFCSIYFVFRWGGTNLKIVEV